MMTTLETDTCIAIKHYLPEIARQLEIANKLKELSLLKECGYPVIKEDVEKAMEG